MDQTSHMNSTRPERVTFTRNDASVLELAIREPSPSTSRELVRWTTALNAIDQLPEIEMSPEEYRRGDYYETERWKRLRRIEFDYWGRTCRICGSDSDLRCHHVTYKRLGRERLFDVMPLDSVCHNLVHAKRIAPMTSSCPSYPMMIEIWNALDHREQLWLVGKAGY